MVAELDAARPAAIVVWLRPTGEYERGLFGRDYGKRVAEWIVGALRRRAFRDGPTNARESDVHVLPTAREFVLTRVCLTLHR